MEGPQHTKSNQNYISSLPIPTIINLLLPSFMKEIFLERHLFKKRNIKKKQKKHTLVMVIFLAGPFFQNGNDIKCLETNL